MSIIAWLQQLTAGRVTDSTGIIQFNFPEADFSLPIVVHGMIASGCTVKRRSTPAVRMPFSVKAGRGDPNPSSTSQANTIPRLPHEADCAVAKQP
jgi:hypothetical protein